MGYIADLHKWAKEMAGDSLHAQNLLIASWSAFKGRDGQTVSILGRPLTEIGPAWLLKIHQRGSAAYERYQLKRIMSRDLFDKPEVEKPESLERLKSATTFNNHPDDIPF